MPLMDDGTARGVEARVKAKTVSASELADVVARLLEDRRSRTAPLQRIARELYHLRARLAQAGRYLDGLLANAQETARVPWPGKLPCALCGAPTEQVLSDYRPQDHRGHVLVRTHADGTRCEADPPPEPTPKADPRGGDR